MPLLAEARRACTGFDAYFRPAGRPWRPGELVRLPALAATLRATGRRGLRRLLRRRPRRAPGPRSSAAGGGPHAAADFRAHASTWTEPISTTYRGVRVTTPPAELVGIVALEILNILEALEPPRAPSARTRRPRGAVADRLDSPRYRGRQARHRRPRRPPHRPGFPRHPGRATARQGLRGGAGRADRPGAGVAPAPSHEPAGRRHDLPRASSTAMATRSA